MFIIVVDFIFRYNDKWYWL